MQIGFTASASFVFLAKFKYDEMRIYATTATVYRASWQL
jgi:hypothetical protein